MLLFKHFHDRQRYTLDSVGLLEVMPEGLDEYQHDWDIDLEGDDE